MLRVTPDDPTLSPDSGPPVGRVLGTADATPLQFWTAVDPDAWLQLDDVVVTHRRLPDAPEPVTIAGVVTAIRARHEGAQFDSDVFAIAEGMLPAQVQEAAEITTTRVTPEIYVPPSPGGPVHRATGEARAAALHFDRMARQIPLGTGRDGLPVFLNADFLDGTSGAHVSISGVSGVATKTSFATFLLYSAFHSEALGADRVNSRALIFNVKGEDLNFLDYPNSHLDEPTAATYGTLGLPAKPFADVHVYAPARAGDPTGTPDVASRTAGVDAFYWTLAQFCQERLLPYVFADADDERQQYTMVVHAVAAALAKLAQPLDSGGVAIEGASLHSYPDLVDYLVDQLADEETRATWAGSSFGLGTVNAFSRRLIASKRDLARLIRGDLTSRRPHTINTAESARVTVVDLHNLPDRAQRFVVGVTLRSEFERKEKSGTARPLLFVVLDELNKYAPREGDSPIKEVLLDIAERGRSLGVVLIGAQQTASEVERRIVANSAVKVVGRLDPAEASRPEYGFLPPAQRQRVLLAKPGTMFVSQPEIPVPLCVEFPFPAWATRPQEAGAAPAATMRSITQAADPFTVVGADQEQEFPF
ncbi:ATP-binding protein [Natronosporangium hydrolyticum]|uniref:ATP-binding protein n=1 Tax=Natronosporangium hydrolyticum TaxID=2811111 RepID=A0A895YPI9_9ACTN|nr:ATP-binding protein [Natronosporangium hydrolyticum]QSB17213.1 ATP-binding protein [Natronosporangium hydrolyticum]